jgi:proline iminopeptidase
MSLAPEPETPIRPLDAVHLNVGDGHWIYVEEVGTRGGVPALFLHGGPGSGAQHWHRRLFDPARFHAILLDQRGAGRSHPYLSRTANTTQHLVSDIETVRAHFGFEKLLIAGGSWGSTLALAYAERYPGRVAGLVLRAIFLGTDTEVQWAFLEGPHLFRPELHRAFVSWLPEAERADPLAHYVARLTNPDPAVHTPAAHIWHAYERALSELNPASAVLPDPPDKSARLPPTPLMEAHYIKHHFFLAPDELLLDASRLAGIPGVIVQGRYDLLCPPKSAHALAARWPTCRLEIVEAAGHSMTEPGVEAAFRQAITRLGGGSGAGASSPAQGLTPR